MSICRSLVIVEDLSEVPCSSINFIQSPRQLNLLVGYYKWTHRNVRFDILTREIFIEGSYCKFISAIRYSVCLRILSYI